MSKWHDFISDGKNGIRMGLSTSINALSGTSNGLVIILLIFIWMDRWCIQWLKNAKKMQKKKKKNPQKLLTNYWRRIKIIQLG